MRGRLIPLAAASLLLCGFDFVADLPENQGLASEALDELVAFSDGFASKTGVLVLRNDRVVLEHYTGVDSEKRFQIKSATKSFGAGLLVKALADGLLTLDDPACPSSAIDLFHTVTMSSGIPKDSTEDCHSTLWFEPGSDFGYSDGSVNVFRDRLRDAYGADLEPLLESALLGPIGAERWLWEEEQRLSSGLAMSVRDMVRYGRLWQRGGDWDGVQVLDADWMALATAPADPDLKPDYGMLWWVPADDPPPPFYARYGFQLNPVFPADAPIDSFLAIGCTRAWILVVPSLDLVAARAGGGCVSMRSGTPQLTDESRQFVSLVLDSVSVCSDGLDNDGDGYIDHPADPGCDGLAGQDENALPEPGSASGLGTGAALLAALSRRRRVG